MNAYAAAPSNAYKESSVLTATPQQLVVMLYDGARRFLLQGAVAMRQGDIPASNDRLQRAEAIIDELTATLDMEAGDVAERLQGIYTFCRRELSAARIERDADKIDQVGRMLGELRDAWAQTSAA
jgi:flagellar protein FliS